MLSGRDDKSFLRRFYNVLGKTIRRVTHFILIVDGRRCFVEEFQQQRTCFLKKRKAYETEAKAYREETWKMEVVLIIARAFSMEGSALYGTNKHHNCVFTRRHQAFSFCCRALGETRLNFTTL